MPSRLKIKRRNYFLEKAQAEERAKKMREALLEAEKEGKLLKKKDTPKVKKVEKRSKKKEAKKEEE